MDALIVLPAGRQRRRGDQPFHVWRTDSEDWIRFYRDGKTILMQFPGLADFRLGPDGAAATCLPARGTDKATLDHLYQNQVLPMILSLKGERVYHGAAIDYEGRAFAVLGQSGRGKSSLTASFAAAGYPFLNDDLLVIEPSGKGFDVRPGTPSVRLWSEARAALLGDRCEIGEPLSYTDKERVLATERLPHCDRPLPLHAAIVLSDETSDITATPLTGSDALAAWMAHAFVLEVDRPAAVQKSFAQTAEIARTVPSIALRYPRDYDALPQVRRAITAAVEMLSEKELSCDP